MPNPAPRPSPRRCPPRHNQGHGRDHPARSEGVARCFWDFPLTHAGQHGLPALLGAAQFRHSFGRLLDWVAEGAVPADDAVRVAEMVGAVNARRLYGL